MSIQSTNTQVTIGTSTALVPLKDFTIDLAPVPVEPPTFSNTQLQEGLRITITMQGIVSAFTTAFQPIFDAMRQFWSNLGMTKKKRMSKQTRLFLATKYKKPHFTPHAQRRRRSQRRMKAILARV